MKRKVFVRSLIASVMTISVSLIALESTALAAAAHGISFTKGCESPTMIGQMNECSYTISQASAVLPGDTYTITSLSDVTASSGGAVSSGNILSSLNLILSGGATCNVGQTQCMIPFGGSISSADFGYYTVTANDFVNANPLSDEATVGWTDVCTTSTNCPIGSQSSTSGSQTAITKNPSNTVTAIQQGDGSVSSVQVGTSVTDQATVSGSDGTPTGTVTFTLFSGDCTTGTVVGSDTENLSSGVANSTSYGPLAAGSYSFSATYNGDGTYLSSTGDCEPLTVLKDSSHTVTVIQQLGGTVTSVDAGTSVTDQATVSGSDGTPTGTVTFTFFSGDCTTGTVVGSDTENLSSGVADSTSYGPLAVGSYSFSATYNGDGTYTASTGDCEPLTVNKIPSNTVTAIQQGDATVTSVSIGTSVTDQATVSGSDGTPTGTVTFTFFSGDCTTGTVVGSDTENLSSGVADSSSYTPAAVGSYSFSATYNGDGTDLTSTGTCEPLTVNKISSNTVTAIKQGGSTVTSVNAGTSVTDQATVSGSDGTPTGTVTFTFFSGDCTTGTVVGSDTENLSSGVANSTAYGPLAVGSYSFSATYNGDGTYLTSTGDCEPLTVNKISSNTVTLIKQGGSTVTSVSIGTSVTDQATVSGSDGTPTGTVTFTFFSGDCTTGTVVGSDTENLSSGVANSSSYTPAAVGSYSFSATYNGDGTYTASTGTCEPLTVNKISSHTVTAIKQGGSTVTSVNAGTSVTDQATVSGSDGTPTGTVTFTFFSGNCTTGTVVGSDTENLSSGVANSTSYGPLSAGNYAFSATFNGDGTYLASTGACEPLTVSTPSVLTLTPGFWKNHSGATTPLLPQTLGGYTVSTFAQAFAVLSNLSCGTSGINCLAGQLLAAELNVANGSNTCISTVVSQADTLLIAMGYNGPGTGTATKAQAAQAKLLASELSTYNSDNAGICPI